MSTGDVFQWYHHAVYNRYWKQYWMIKDWIKHRQLSHQAPRLRAFNEMTQISQDQRCYACRTLHETPKISWDQHCTCRHDLNHRRTFLETTQISQNQCYLGRNDFNHHSRHYRSSGFSHVHPVQQEQHVNFIQSYPKYFERSLRSCEKRPRISENLPIQNSSTWKAELDNSDSKLKFIESQKLQQKRDAVRSTVEERRKWICTEYGEKYLKNPECENGLDFTVMTYNLLSDQNLWNTSYLYTHCKDYVLDWSYRAPNLLREIEKQNVDVVCLQEVEKKHFENIFQPHLESIGYLGIFKKKTGNQNDGCAVFFKARVFALETYVAVEFRNREASVLNRDNVGLVVILKPKSSEEDVKLCVATTHLIFNSKRGDVKLSQLRVLLAEIDKLAFKEYSESNHPVYHPIILCGDMNSEPFSPLYNFLTCGFIHFENMKAGSVSGQPGASDKGKLMTMTDLSLSPLGINEESCYKRLDENRYKKWLSVFYKANVKNVALESCVETSAEIQYGTEDNSSSSGVIRQPGSSTEGVATMRHEKSEVSSFSHHLKLVSSYKHFKLDGTKEATIYNSDTGGNVDYIFYGVKCKHSFVDQGMPVHKNVKEDSLKLLGCYGLLGAKDLKDIGGLPNSHLSSDHTCLISRFLLKF